MPALIIRVMFFLFDDDIANKSPSHGFAEVRRSESAHNH